MSQSAHREVYCSFCLQDSTQVHYDSFRVGKQIFALNVLSVYQHPQRIMLHCTFCRRDNTHVERLFNGLEADICEKCLSECIDLCNDILNRKPDGSLDFSMGDIQKTEGSHEQPEFEENQGNPQQARGRATRERRIPIQPTAQEPPKQKLERAHSRNRLHLKRLKQNLTNM